MIILAFSFGWQAPIGILFPVIIAGLVLLYLLGVFKVLGKRYVSMGQRALVIGCVLGLLVSWMLYRPPPEVHRVAILPFYQNINTNPPGMGIGIAHTAVDLLRRSLPEGTRVIAFDVVDEIIDKQTVFNHDPARNGSTRNDLGTLHTSLNRESVTDLSAHLGAGYTVYGTYELADSTIILHTYFLNVQDSTEVARDIHIPADRLSDAPLQIVQALTEQYPVFASQDSTRDLVNHLPSEQAFANYSKGQELLLVGQLYSKEKSSPDSSALDHLDIYWDAYNAFTKALEADSTYALAHYGMAKVYKAWQQRGFKFKDQNAVMRQKVIERAKTALILNPHLNEAYRLMASVYKDQKQWEELSIVLKQAIAADPSEPYNYVGLIKLLPERFQDLGFKDEAELCERAAYLNPDAILLWTSLVDGYIEAGKLRNARLFAEDALEKAPGNIKLLEAAGIAYHYAGEPYSSIEVYEQAIEKEPFKEELYFGLATAYSIISDHPKAIETYVKGIEKLPDNATLYYNLGVLYQRIGDWEKSVPWFERAIVRNHVDAHFYMARWYEKQGNRQKAIEHWEQRILKGNPNEKWTQDAIRRLKVLSPSAVYSIGVSR